MVRIEDGGETMANSEGRAGGESRGGRDDALYVPEDELSEALSLGARWTEGDARLLMPRPLPPGVAIRDFERWTSGEARYRWCMRYMAELLGSMVKVADVDGLLQSLGEGAAAHERVYMWVPAFDVDRVREIEGVEWDKRRRMYYATPFANMNDAFPWLTPAAKSIWEAEQVLRRALTLMVQEQARRETRAPPGSGGEVLKNETGAPKHRSSPSRTQPF